MLQPEKYAKGIVVLAHGTFDILHVGHHYYLEEARAMGDYLIVSVSTDEQVAKIKPGRPIFTHTERAKQLRDLRFVDEVVISDGSTGAESIMQIRPHIFVRGPDYKETGIHHKEKEACLKVGCSIRYTDARKYSSSHLLRHLY